MVGFEHFSQEFIRFKVQPSLQPTTRHISSFHEPGDGPAIMAVNFMGLVGAAGVLPRHYTQLILDRIHEGDFAMRDFLDLFHHRTISYFFRAGLKYSFPQNYELSQKLGSGSDDPISNSLFALTGYGLPRLRQRNEFKDDAFVYFAGKFCHQQKTASSLKYALQDIAGVDVQVTQFQKEWLYLSPQDQSRLSSEETSQLGRTTLLGERVTSIQNRIRIHLGPLSWSLFTDLHPQGQRIKKLAQFVKAYVGISIDFEFQLLLRADEVSPLSLGESSSGRLGWSSWLGVNKAGTIVDDSVFEVPLP